MMQILILLVGFISIPAYSGQPASSPSDRSVSYQTSREMLEALRGKFEGEGITEAKTAVDKYLSVYGASSEKTEAVAAAIRKISTTDLPPIAKKLEDMKAKQAELEKQYTDGMITKEQFAKSESELNAIRDQVAGHRKTILDKEKELAPLQKALIESQTGLSKARAKLKETEDKIMLAAGQSLAQLSLQQMMDQVKLEGLAAQDKLDLIEAMLADTVLETYVKGKFQKMFSKENLCPELRKCSGLENPGKPDLKGVFPGRKTH